MSATAAHNRDWTAADLMEQFGPILLHRIRSNPSPGTATEQDVIAIHERERRSFELIDGVLVEKTVGVQESFLAVMLAGLLNEFAQARGLGFVLGADGMIRLNPGLVRIPDISFITWGQFPDRKVPAATMLDVPPDLAVEILSPSNTAQEMDRKLNDYFNAGVRLVWYVDPRSRSVRVYTSAEAVRTLDHDQSLTGDPVLPEFTVSLRELFAHIDS